MNKFFLESTCVFTSSLSVAELKMINFYQIRAWLVTLPANLNVVCFSEKTDNKLSGVMGKFSALHSK